ncbi:helix-turn-helix domain-containing protein [Streptomyces sp. NPDC087219]|uniref:helix-turn-helix domain-containing protein n=1 Tax=Streptomyces sp. NPDC087219 TaxID=3365770 RepID=UPI0038163CFD
MTQGMSNSAACREVGVNRKTGNRWTYGRTVKNKTGEDYVYAPIAEKKDGQVSERFLSEDERVQIADLLCAGHSLRSIARRLGRNPSTISHELHRNSNPATGAYQPFQAQRRAVVRRARSKEGKLRRDPELKEFVELHLGKRWSPEQISRALPAAFPRQLERHLSTETIYQAIYLPHRTGSGHASSCRSKLAWSRSAIAASPARADGSTAGAPWPVPRAPPAGPARRHGPPTPPPRAAVIPARVVGLAHTGRGRSGWTGTLASYRGRLQYVATSSRVQVRYLVKRAPGQHPLGDDGAPLSQLPAASSLGPSPAASALAAWFCRAVRAAARSRCCCMARS